MQVANELENSDVVDPAEYIRQKEEFEEQRDDFMRKYLRRAWPIRIVRLLGLLQLLISLAILGVDLPINLMLAPRWQVLAGCWTFIFGFIACISTIHSTRKMTWLKLKWAVGLNVLAGLAASIMLAFNILYLVNPYICLIAGGCSYLWYTYSIANRFYTGEVVLGIALFLTAFIFLILFIKYGIGGTILFESIQNGWASNSFKPIVPPHGTVPVPPTPTTGPGALMAGPRPPGFMPGYPPPPPGSMPRYLPPGPGVMMNRQYGPMMVSGPRGPMMVPGPRGPMQGYYREPVPYPSSARRYQH